ncbi:helix-turn-helix domain-containing protein [Parasphingorhabdus sp.]|uniref:helix-turn-helix domain-containing protein n=1 Tax=Parasphingorhabdus sp. TaxID=2709688 RepID=UPI003D2BF68C
MKRINPRLAKLHRSYSVFELANLLGVHRHTVREWLKKGLPKADDTRPVLILGSDFQSWWSKQRKKEKRPLQPGQFYCCKCRDAKAPALGMVEYAATNGTTGNLKAMCETCETVMHRRVRLTDIPAKMPNLDVRLTQAVPSIMERTNPSLNADYPKGA